MTNYEQLLQAKTKDDYNKALFEFETELRFNQAIGENLDVYEWLDDEVDAERTMRRSLAVLLKMMVDGKRKAEGKNDEQRYDYGAIDGNARTEKDE